ncbi:thiol:disulfide interchange protein DsbA/DsbL [Dokdonella sp.]|uniref:thiol:disulfide interchange protein DsbA/DsbL n=1 Tax=Dokdonella sp. TaxID=2291710 RepID=UPI001B1A76AC|nr:thiol:disulfide interchange protein DsbA/DsbL [Dokdonella sp.]MBO9661946.1 thiol:disulfide interchange protein DsbA/DsbL [Dokdonella sp.]
MFARSLILAAGLLFAAVASAADAPKWEAGKHYAVIDPPAPTGTGDKVEVLEVFSYACPHCAHFQPYAEKLKASLPKNAEFTLMPADFQPIWLVFARGFYTAKSMGLLDKTHQALFDALYRDHLPIRTIEQLADFYAEHGADKQNFLSTAQSFIVEGQLEQIRSREAAYGVDSTPTLIINGKYRVAINSEAEVGFDQMVEIAQYLVAQEAKKAKK